MRVHQYQPEEKFAPAAMADYLNQPLFANIPSAVARMAA
jgi:hypothetical protein